MTRNMGRVFEKARIIMAGIDVKMKVLHDRFPIVGVHNFLSQRAACNKHDGVGVEEVPGICYPALNGIERKNR